MNYKWLFLFFLIGCHNQGEKVNNLEDKFIIVDKSRANEVLLNYGLTTGVATLEGSSGNSREVEFHVLENKSKKALVNVPANWELLEDKNFFLKTKLDQGPENHFLIIRHDRSALGITMEDLLEYTESSLKTDSVYILKDYSIKKNVRSIKGLFMIEALLAEKGEELRTRSYYTSDNKFLYEFCLKYKGEFRENASYDLILDWIVGSAVVDDKNLIKGFSLEHTTEF